MAYRDGSQTVDCPHPAEADLDDLTPRVCRRLRLMLGLTHTAIAEQADIAMRTARCVEKPGVETTDETLRRVRQVYRDAAVGGADGDDQ